MLIGWIRRDQPIVIFLPQNKAGQLLRRVKPSVKSLNQVSSYHISITPLNFQPYYLNFHTYLFYIHLNFEYSFWGPKPYQPIQLTTLHSPTFNSFVSSHESANSTVRWRLKCHTQSIRHVNRLLVK